MTTRTAVAAGAAGAADRGNVENGNSTVGGADRDGATGAAALTDSVTAGHVDIRKRDGAERTVDRHTATGTADLAGTAVAGGRRQVGGVVGDRVDSRQRDVAGVAAGSKSSGRTVGGNADGAEAVRGAQEYVTGIVTGLQRRHGAAAGKDGVGEGKVAGCRPDADIAAGSARSAARVDSGTGEAAADNVDLGQGGRRAGSRQADRAGAGEDSEVPGAVDGGSAKVDGAVVDRDIDVGGEGHRAGDAVDGCGTRGDIAVEREVLGVDIEGAERPERADFADTDVAGGAGIERQAAAGGIGVVIDRRKGDIIAGSATGLDGDVVVTDDGVAGDGDIVNSIDVPGQRCAGGADDVDRTERFGTSTKGRKTNGRRSGTADIEIVDGGGAENAAAAEVDAAGSRVDNAVGGDGDAFGGRTHVDGVDRENVAGERGGAVGRDRQEIEWGGAADNRQADGASAG